MWLSRVPFSGHQRIICLRGSSPIKPGTALSRCGVRSGGGNSQINCGARIGLTPDFQVTAHKSSPLLHTAQAPVTRAPFVGHNLWVDAYPIIANSHPQLAFVIADLHFDPARLCVQECVAKCLASNPEDIAPQDRVEIA